MQTTGSADGTTIAYQRSGSGPALVLVTGAFCDHNSPAGLSAILGAAFTVFSYDRRGRGSSSDTQPYSVGREVEDLAAVLGEAGGQAAVYGHSSGARLALAAAAAGVPMTRLAVYEPPFRLGEPDPRAATLRSRVEKLLAAGDRRGAAVLHLTESGTPESVVQFMQAAPWWPRMEAFAPTLPYDEALCGDLTLPVQQLAAVGVPTLVLGGGESDPGWLAALRAVADAIPQAHWAQVEGQGHVPADDVVAGHLVDFLGGP